MTTGSQTVTLEAFNELQAMFMALKQQLDKPAADPKADVEVEPVTYYHAIPNTTFVVCTKGPSGENIPKVCAFVQNEFTTSSSAIQAELDVLTKQQSSFITRDPKIKNTDREKAADVVKDHAAEAIAKLASAKK
jgi:hypothetical protein